MALVILNINIHIWEKKNLIHFLLPNKHNPPGTHLQSSSHYPVLSPSFCLFSPRALLPYDIAKNRVVGAESVLTPKIWLLLLLPLTQKPKAFYKSGSISPRKSLLFLSSLSLANSNRFLYWVLFCTPDSKKVYLQTIPSGFLWALVNNLSFTKKANTQGRLSSTYVLLYLLFLVTWKNSGR